MPYPSLITESGVFSTGTRDAINALISGQGILSQGNVWWVRPTNGADTNDGLSPASAFRSLTAALAAAVANQNDVVLLCAEGNTASVTTNYQAATLNWNKDLVHLIGVNSGPMIGQRSRVALVGTYATASNLFTHSANGCLIVNLEFFAGVASALPTGCLNLTGQRNHFVNCQISGMGNAANDIAGAYSLRLGAAQENLLENCYIGLDTVTLGAAANSQILCASAATRNIFKNCKIATYTNHATNNNFLRAPTGSLDRWLMFEDCQFINPIDASSTNLTQAMIVASDAGGSVLLVGSKTGVLGATDWNSTDSGNVTAVNGTVTAGTFGLAVDVTR